MSRIRLLPYELRFQAKKQVAHGGVAGDHDAGDRLQVYSRLGNSSADHPIDAFENETPQTLQTFVLRGVYDPVYDVIAT